MTFEAYPSWRYHRELEPRLITGPAEEPGPEWADTPAAFAGDAFTRVFDRVSAEMARAADELPAPTADPAPVSDAPVDLAPASLENIGLLEPTERKPTRRKR
jgi:hypothetical protein